MNTINEIASKTTDGTNTSMNRWNRIKKLIVLVENGWKHENM